jgi:hypothetical protein
MCLAMEELWLQIYRSDKCFRSELSRNSEIVFAPYILT